MAFGQSAHQFTYPQLSHDVTANAQPYIRVSFFFKKRPEISYDQFFKYWQTVHADLTISVQAFGASNLQRYVQVCFIANGQIMSLGTEYHSFTKIRT